MPVAATSLKIKRFRQRFGIRAPRVAVRTHIHWSWHLLLGLVLVLVAAAAAVSAWRALFGSQAEERLLAATLRIEQLEKEVSALRQQTGTEQSAVKMEQTARQQMLGKLKTLERENTVLKEELGFFERLVSDSAPRSPLRIERLRVTPDEAPDNYRYRLLLAFQPDKQNREFRGSLQLEVTYRRGDEESILVLPKSAGTADFQLEIRHFLRKEGVFSLPAAARLLRVEARLIQDGAIKARHTITQ